MSIWKIPLAAEPEWREIEALQANPGNWRRHSSAQERVLLEMLGRIGVVERPLVSKRTGTLLDGHSRVKLARAAGESGMLVDVVDVDEEQERVILATLDSLAEMATGSPPPSPAARILRERQAQRTAAASRGQVGVGGGARLAGAAVKSGERAEVIGVEEYDCIWVRVERNADREGVMAALAEVCERTPGVLLTGGDI